VDGCGAVRVKEVDEIDDVFPIRFWEKNGQQQTGESASATLCVNPISYTIIYISDCAGIATIVRFQSPCTAGGL